MHFDVIVVGAGPGGSTAAKFCADEGLNVALLEKQPTPGLKVCAGGLEFQVIQEFDIDESVVECFPERLYFCDRKRWAENKMTYANVYRKNFDSYLAKRAVNSGAKLFTSTECIGVLEKNKQVKGVIVKSSKDEDKEILGDIVVAADGFNSATARSAGLCPHLTRSDIGVTIQCEVSTKSRVKDDSIYLFYGHDIANCGYGWIYPKKNSYTVGLGCLSSEMRGGGLIGKLKYLIYQHPIASKILYDTTSISKLEGACIPLKQSDRIYDNSVLVVGDAAGHVAPLSGSGIYYAMEAGRLAGNIAAEAVSRGDVSLSGLQKYEEIWQSQFGRELQRQKRILAKLGVHFGKYMETQIFLRNYPEIGKITGKSLSLVKKLLFH